MSIPPPASAAPGQIGPLVLAAVLSTVVVCAPMWFDPTGMSINDDWLTFYAMHAMMRLSVVEHGEFPLWSPWVGGGYPIAGHPEFPNLTPFVLPTLAFGEVVGWKVNVTLFCLIGALGMAALCHGPMRLGLGGSLVAVCAYTFSGWLPGRVVSGNPIELHILWFPLLVVLFERARRGRRLAPILGMAAILAVTMVDGKWTSAALGLMLGVWAVTYCAGGPAGLRRPMLWPLAVCALAAGGAVLLAAAKLIPLHELLLRADRIVPDNPIRYADLNFLNPGRLIEELTLGWPKIKYMVGFVPLGLAAAAVIRQPRWSWRWAVVGGLAIWLMIGRHAPVDLFALLWHLPVFNVLSSSHIPFGGFAITAICVLAGRGADHLVGEIGGQDAGVAKRGFRVSGSGCRPEGAGFGVPDPRHTTPGTRFRSHAVPRFPRRWTMGVLVVLTVVPQAVRTLPAMLPVFESRAIRVPMRGLDPTAFYQVATDDLLRRGEAARPLAASEYARIAAGSGLIDWRGTILLPERANPRLIVHANGALTEAAAHRGAEVWCLDIGRARLTGLTPNTIEVHVAAAGPTTVVINQNYHPDWEIGAQHAGVAGSGERQPPCAVPRFPVRHADGLVAVEVPEPGEHTIRLVFRSRAFRRGAVVSGCAWAALAAALVAAAVQRRRRPASCRTRPAVAHHDCRA